jgi:hypothetical protein
LRRLEFHIAAIRLDEGEIIRIGEPVGILTLGEAGERLARIAPIAPLLEDHDDLGRVVNPMARDMLPSATIKSCRRWACCRRKSCAIATLPKPADLSRIFIVLVKRTSSATTIVAKYQKQRIEIALLQAHICQITSIILGISIGSFHA